MGSDTKLCRRCGEVKNRLTDFNFRSNGHIISPCKACQVEGLRAYRARRPDVVRDQKRRYRAKAAPGHIAAQQDRARQANPDRYAQINRRWIAANPDRVAQSNRASRAVRSAIERGELVRPSACQECGREATRIEAAHADYSRPLDVRWLCKRCHARWDAAQPKTRSEGMCGV